MKLNIKELKELRASKVAAMDNLVEERGETMDEKTLGAIRSFKQEIIDIDLQIEAIDEVRSIATKNSMPAAEKAVDAKDEFKRSYDLYLRGKIDEKELRAVGAGDVAKGKETVPEDFLRELQETILEFGVIAPLARNIMTEDHGQLSIPTIDDTANAGVWTAEHGAITPADFATGEITMDAWKVATAIVVSNELLEDAFFDVAGYVSRALGVRLSRTMEAAYINGDGTSKPEGILGVATAVNSITTVTVEAADALALIAAIQPSSRNGASFFASDDMIIAMTGWVDADGRPLLQVSASSTQADGVQYTLYGYNVTPNYELGLTSVVADVPLIFGNPQTYMIRNVRNITVRRSDDVNILTDEAVFVATARVDGKIVSANDSFSKLVIKA